MAATSPMTNTTKIVTGVCAAYTLLMATGFLGG